MITENGRKAEGGRIVPDPTAQFAAAFVMAFAVLAPVAETSAHASQPASQPPSQPHSEAFVAAFGEVCIPERLSYVGTTALAKNLGWRPVVQGENIENDSFIDHSDSMLAEAVVEAPDLYEASDGAWFTREVDGRLYLLAVSLLLTEVMDTLGCYLYDFAATAPIDPEPVTTLLGRPIAYATDGDDPLYAVDPDLFVSTVWGPPPSLPRTGDTYLTFIPEGSEFVAQTGFSGLMLKFSTSLPGREGRRK